MLPALAVAKSKTVLGLLPSMADRLGIEVGQRINRVVPGSIPGAGR